MILPLYQAALDVARNQFGVRLWMRTIDSLPTTIQDFANQLEYAKVQLEKAQVHLGHSEIELQQLGGGQSPNLAEYVLFFFVLIFTHSSLSSIFVSFPITNIYYYTVKESQEKIEGPK